MSESINWCRNLFVNYSFLYKVGIILAIWGARCIAESVSANSNSLIIQSAVESFSAITFTLTIAAIALGLIWLYLGSSDIASTPKNAPPMIPSQVPFLGCAIEFNKNPVDFLIRMKNKYGSVFTMKMAGKKFTYLLGSEASSLLFNSKNEDLNAEDVYGKLVTPVFGKGVAYDVPNDVFLEQKKMFKNGLSVARFKDYVPIIEQEVREYLSRWGDSGEVDLFHAFSEMIVNTASHCLHGKEIRSVLDERVARLYYELDQGFCPEAWLLPSWLHWIVPKLRRRDAAHKQMKKIFYAAIEKRRQSGEIGEDMLQTLLDTPYKSGRHMTDDEIAGMLIGLLMAGQHTSSSTSSWLGLFLAKHQDVQAQCYEEQCEIRGGGAGADLMSVEYDELKSMTVLDRCFKETLRLRPPIYVIIRQSRRPLDVCGYTIPKDHSVCVSPTTNQRLLDTWGADCTIFNPDRFSGGETSLTGDAKFSYVPFGAGRHRCIGESFAYIQNKTIWSILLEQYELSLPGNFPEPNYAGMIHTPISSTVRYQKRVKPVNI